MYLIKSIKIYSFIIGLILLNSFIVNCAQIVSIDASVDKDTVNLDESFTLSIIMKGGPEVSMTNNIEMPELDNFNVVGSSSSQTTSFSVSSGEVETIKSIQYVLMPIKSGEFTIGAIKFQSAGQIVQSNPIKINVLNKIVNTPAPNFLSTPSFQYPTPDNSSFASKDLWVFQQVDKSEAYVNEQIILTFKFYYRVDIYGSSEYQSPNATGFIPVKLSQSTGPKEEVVNGVKYYVEEIKTAIFSVSSGKKTIGPATLNVPVDLWNYQALKSNELKVNIKPLPTEGRPDTFSGAVGEFTIYLKPDKQEVEINQPITLELVVEGWGNGDTIGQPKLPNIPDCKIYPSGSSENTKTQGDAVYSQKKFKYVFIPNKNGPFEIPEISYSFFNITSKKYETIKTKTVKISVSGTGEVQETKEQKEIKIVGQDINYIKTSHLSLENNLPLYKSAIFIVFILFPPILLLISYFYKRHIDRLSFDVSFARFRRSFKNAKIIIKEAKHIINKQDDVKFYSLLDKSLREYVGDKLNLPPASLTLEQISLILKDKKTDKTLLDLLEKFYQNCEYARFAPGNSSNEQREEDLKMLEKLLLSLEKIKF